MSDDERDEAALEEERLNRALSGARGRTAKAILGAKKVVSPGAKHQRGPSDNGTATSPRSTGPTSPRFKDPNNVPEWKRKQMEREETEKKQREEEEKKKAQYVASFVTAVHEHGSQVDTSSAVQDWVDHVDPISGNRVVVAETPASHKADEPEPETGAALLEKDEEEELRREEDRLSRRTTGTHLKSPRHAKQPSSGHGIADAHLALPTSVHKVNVRWTDDKGKLIQEGAFFLSQGRLPVMALLNGWNVKNVVWRETGQGVVVQPDGYSNINFGTRDVIEIKADRQ